MLCATPIRVPGSARSRVPVRLALPVAFVASPSRGFCSEKVGVEEVLATCAARRMKSPSTLVVPTESEAARAGERYAHSRAAGVYSVTLGLR